MVAQLEEGGHGCLAIGDQLERDRDQDVLARPGYSTAPEVTDLAGRGVGLDAVKSYVQSMGGTFEVRSEPGLGMEVVLQLPLALALLDVLLFERGETVYGVPLAVAEEVVMVTRTLVLEGRAVLDVRGRLLPVADVADLVGAHAPLLDDRPGAAALSRCATPCWARRNW